MRRLVICFLLVLFSVTGAAFAASAPQGSTIPTERPDEIGPAGVFSGTPVTLEHSGSDALGMQLSVDFKNVLNSNSLFGLKEGDGPKIKVLIFTQSEFPSRPGVGSMFSAIWLYAESPKVFPTYLDSLQGVVTNENKADVVTGLVQKTDAIATKYSYIFK